MFIKGKFVNELGIFLQFQFALIYYYIVISKVLTSGYVFYLYLAIIL